MALLNLLFRVLIVIVIVGIAKTLLPILFAMVLPELVWWALSGVVLFIVSWISHGVLGFDILPWIP